MAFIRYYYHYLLFYQVLFLFCFLFFEEFLLTQKTGLLYSSFCLLL